MIRIGEQISHGISEKIKFLRINLMRNAKNSTLSPTKKTEKKRHILFNRFNIIKTLFFKSKYISVIYVYIEKFESSFERR